MEMPVRTRGVTMSDDASSDIEMSDEVQADSGPQQSTAQEDIEMEAGANQSDTDMDTNDAIPRRRKRKRYPPTHSKTYNLRKTSCRTEQP